MVKIEAVPLPNSHNPISGNVVRTWGDLSLKEKVGRVALSAIAGVGGVVVPAVAYVAGRGVAEVVSDRVDALLDNPPRTPDKYTVKRYDTASDIALKYLPKGGDPTQLATKIMQETEHDGTKGLQPGDKVSVPFKPSKNKY